MGMTTDSTFTVRRRKHRVTPMRSHRIGALSAAAGGATLDIPFDLSAEPFGSARSRWSSASIAALVHAGILGLLFLLAALVPEEIREEFLKFELTPEAPAPSPKVLAESSSANFAPAVQAIAPQVINPNVISRAAPAVVAQATELNPLAPIAAPTLIANTPTVAATTVTAVQSVAAATAVAVDVAQLTAPAFRGPMEANAPTGPSVGPKQVTTSGTTIGTSSFSFGSGSSVREGIVSGRDVLGSADGVVVADVNTQVGQGHMQGGTGGTGTGTGGGNMECFQRPVVRHYLEAIQSRMISRWILPTGVDSNQSVSLSFTLGPEGSARQVKLVATKDSRLGQSALEALRSAAPFPPIPADARCMANRPINGTFRNPTATR